MVPIHADGRHELTYMGGPHKGLVVDRHGQGMAQLQGEPAYGGKILDLPGEQIVTWDEEGTVRIYAWPEARDTAEAKARYQHPYYAACLRLWAMAYNRCNVAGI